MTAAFLEPAVLFGNLIGVGALALLLWIASVRLRDVSIVDAWWSVFFLWIGWQTAWQTGVTPGKALLLSLTTLWAVRLALHLAIRNHGQPEDPRYAAFRERFGRERYWWFSLFQVFLLQGALALLVSVPLQVAGSAAAPDPISATDLVGTALFLFGFAFEAVGDEQLRRFRKRRLPGQVLDTGLWRYTRHPNYFGEAVLWWGFGLLAVDTPWGWAALAGPALMTWLLLRVSGVAMLDEHMQRTKPAFAAYAQRTSAFFPRVPRD